MENKVSLASAIDYETLFDRRIAQSYYGVEPQPLGVYYDDDRGLVVETDDARPYYKQDLIQLAPDILAFTGVGTPAPLPSVGHHIQTLSDDWIHFTLCLESAISENVLGLQLLEQPIRECTIVRYPAKSVIDRISRPNRQYKVSCLWLKPAALLRLLELSESRVPDELFWLKPGHIEQVHYTSVPLTAQVYHAVNEILACPFSGGVRRTFVRSKYLEILSTIYQALVDGIARKPQRYSNDDHHKIEAVATYLTSNLAVKDSLADIARRVGMNRTKLVGTFKEVYGTSVEAYWREWRLQTARELLGNDGMTVSDVAEKVGYSEVSAFTRAFSKQFGISPNKARVR